MTAPMADAFRRMAAEGGGWRMQASDTLVDKWGLEERSAVRARREGWGYHELPTGHDCQAEMSDAFE
jgi:hypothetical protein